MTIGRFVGVAFLLAVSPLSPAFAQSSPDIVVDGVVEKPSEWKRAESAHVIVTSKGSEAELKRVTNNLERLYWLLSRVLRPGPMTDEPVKLQVTLIDSPDAFRALGLHNKRTEEGPYPPAFANQRYYDPRESGDVIAVVRTDQTVPLNTKLAEDADLSDAAATDGESAPTTSMMATAAKQPISRAWEGILYSAFAQRFLLTYKPAAYPRWYLDGIGALFSTATVRSDGKIEYARDPEHYRLALRSYGDLNAADILTGHYLDLGADKAHWTPYHAWLVTHYFLFSKLTAEQGRQFYQYMMAIQRGVPMAEAAKVFGNLTGLRDHIESYGEKGTDFARTEAPPPAGGDPLITTLTHSGAAMVEARLALDSHLAAPDGDPAWIAQIHAQIAQLPYVLDAYLLDAEAQCRTGHYAECRIAAERVLAKSPGDANALAWKGAAQTREALSAAPADRPTLLAAGRATIEAAIKVDPTSPLPLIAHFRSYTAAGEPVPDAVMLEMAKVTRLIPDAPTPRLSLARELMRQGQPDLARRILLPILYGGYDSPEKTAALALFATPVATPAH